MATYEEQTRLQIREMERREQLFEEMEQLVGTHGPQDVLTELYHVFQNERHTVNGCPEEAQWIILANAVKALANGAAASRIDGLTPAERHCIDHAPSNDEGSS